jgi:hypothetical protein
MASAATAETFANEDYRLYEITVGFMTDRPAIGRLEYILYYTREANPSREDILQTITPYVLAQLGGLLEDWMIATHPINEFNQHLVYSFDWKNLDNKARACPLMRTISHRTHLHQTTLVVEQRI